MQLVNEFVVPRGIDETWAVLTDVERIAPAMPGAELTGVEDGKYHGKVKIKVGPVTAAYAGVASFRELDQANHHMVLDATGKESNGRGRAAAVVMADLIADGVETKVKVTTDLTISGPLAQFGRGAIAEVSSRLLNQFVANLKASVLADGPADAPPAPATATTATDATAAPAPAASTGASSGGAASDPAPAVDPVAAVATATDAPTAAPVGPTVPPADPSPVTAASAAGAPEVGAAGASSGPTVGTSSDTPDGAPSAGDALESGPADGATAPPDGAPADGALAAARDASAPADGAPAPATSAPTSHAVPLPPAGVGAARPAAPVAEVNLLKVAAWPILKRLIPLLIVIVVIVVLIVWLA